MPLLRPHRHCPWVVLLFELRGFVGGQHKMPTQDTEIYNEPRPHDAICLRSTWRLNQLDKTSAL
jgi:hypothetical protein